MFNPSHHSVFSRRLAAAVVVPGVLTSMLLFAPQATATTGSVTGICNGVVNQLAHRGTVQENLLKASARKNADIIARLQAESSTLQATAAALTAEIAAADASIAALEAAQVTLDGEINAVQDELTADEAERSSTAAAVLKLQGTLAGLEAERVTTQNELAPLQ
ncbi:MAG TPA: chromosome segregation ATPase, partial [Arthrobacter sp.]|nr:chromosome segregation ATPase [Arthrobacter sp.]